MALTLVELCNIYFEVQNYETSNIRNAMLLQNTTKKIRFISIQVLTAAASFSLKTLLQGNQFFFYHPPRFTIFYPWVATRSASSNKVEIEIES